MGRGHPRQQVTLFIGGRQATDGGPPRPLGRTRDLSPSGVYVVTPQRPPVGQRQQISLVWGEEAVFCLAKVIRHGEDGVAFQFEEPGAGFVKALNDILGGGGSDGVGE